MTYGIIYTITNRINSKQYVGQTVQSVESRWAQHVRDAYSNKKKTRCGVLWNAIRKYGPNQFDVEAVIACDSREELDRIETMAIEAGGTLAPGGYNLQTGGSNGRHSPESRAKIGAAHKGMKRSPETCANISASLKGKIAPNKGKPMSHEQRAKLSAIGKGKPPPNKGKPMSLEARAKMSMAHKGKPLSLEHRAKLSAIRKGKSKSSEWRAKMSAAHRGEKNHLYGKHHSVETRAKMSTAHKEYYRRIKSQES